MTNEREHMNITPPNGNPGTVPPWIISPPAPLPSTPAPPLPGPVDADSED